MTLAHPPYVAWCPDAEPFGIIILRNVNIYNYKTARTRIPYPGIYRYLKCRRMDTQIILWYSQWGTSWHGFPMAGMYYCHQQDIPILTTHQRNIKYHRWFTLKVLLPLRQIPHKKFQIHSPTTDRGIIPNQTTSQKYYLMYIVSHVVIEDNKWISKSDETKQYFN